MMKIKSYIIQSRGVPTCLPSLPFIFAKAVAMQQQTTIPQFFSSHITAKTNTSSREKERETANKPTMRPLTEDETKILFLKLSEYIGTKNVERLIHRSDERYCFRILKGERVYYISESLMKVAATSIGKDHLLHAGTCFGKLNKKGTKFRLHITALEYLSQYAMYKVWIKPANEMSFLYGNHITKNGLARMTENTPQYAGVIVYSMSQDIPLGFGIAAQNSEYAQQLDPTGNVVLHQADIGDYLRGLEDDIF
jgi:60S ribosome subunit biogenesis protein NIP7